MGHLKADGGILGRQAEPGAEAILKGDEYDIDAYAEPFGQMIHHLGATYSALVAPSLPHPLIATPTPLL